MGVRSHVKTHGAIHAFWTIAVLIAIIAWLLVHTVNGSDVQQYIGFASSVASLLLAVIAIGYSFITNQGMTDSAITLNRSSADVAKAANSILDSSNRLSLKVDDITGQVKRVPASVEALSAKIDARIFAEAEKQSIGELPLSDTSEVFKSHRLGGQIGLYILAKSYIMDIAFDSTEIFKVDGKAGAWDGITTGVVLAIAGFTPCGIKVDLITNKAKKLYLNKVLSFGTIDPKEIISLMEASTDEVSSDLVKSIGQYFKSCESSDQD